MCKRNVEMRSCNHCWCGKAISIACCECVFVALGIQHAMRMCRIFSWGLTGCTYKIILYYLINGKIFGKNSLNIKFVLSFCTTFV